MAWEKTLIWHQLFNLMAEQKFEPTVGSGPTFCKVREMEHFPHPSHWDWIVSLQVWTICRGAIQPNPSPLHGLVSSASQVVKWASPYFPTLHSRREQCEILSEQDQQFCSCILYLLFPLYLIPVFNTGIFWNVETVSVNFFVKGTLVDICLPRRTPKFKPTSLEFPLGHMRQFRLLFCLWSSKQRGGVPIR